MSWPRSLACSQGCNQKQSQVSSPLLDDIVMPKEFPAAGSWEWWARVAGTAGSPVVGEPPPNLLCPGFLGWVEGHLRLWDAIFCLCDSKMSPCRALRACRGEGGTGSGPSSQRLC